MDRRLANADACTGPAPDLVLVPEGRQVFPKFSVLDNLRPWVPFTRRSERLDADLDEIFAICSRSSRSGVISGPA